MTGIMSAFWSMTINNPTETDWALVKTPRPDFIRVLIHTEEVGEEGTPHIQAWFKLHRQQRLSYVKKLFPRGHFKALTSDEYNLNSMLYAQKTDETTVGRSVIQCNPSPDPVNELLEVLREVIRVYPRFRNRRDDESLDAFATRWVGVVERANVTKSPRLAKFYVSPLYAKVKQNYLHSLLEYLEFENEDEGGAHTTHTHTQDPEENISVPVYTDDASSVGEDLQCSGSEEEGSEGDEEGESEADGGYTEGSGSDSGEEDDSEEC